MGPFSRNQELINQELPRSNIMPTRPAQAGRLQLGSEDDFFLGFFWGGCGGIQMLDDLKTFWAQIWSVTYLMGRMVWSLFAASYAELGVTRCLDMFGPSRCNT